MFSGVRIESFYFSGSNWIGESDCVSGSVIFSNSVTLESSFASESGVVLSVGLIVGVISGVLFLIIGVIGGYFLRKRMCQNGQNDGGSDSPTDNHDIGTMNETLTETLVPLLDSVTIEGIPADSLDSQSSSVWDKSSLDTFTSFRSKN
jgi:hypothetical protein